MWSLEPSLQCKNVLGIIVLHFVSCPPGRWVKNLPANAGYARDVFYPRVEDPLPFSREEHGQEEPVFFSREFHGWRSLAGYSPWGWKNRAQLKQFSMHPCTCMHAHSVGMGLDFNVTAPLLQSCCSFSFVIGHGVSFWWVLASFCWWLFNS